MASTAPTAPWHWGQEGQRTTKERRWLELHNSGQKTRTPVQLESEISTLILGLNTEPTHKRTSCLKKQKV